MPVQRETKLIGRVKQSQMYRSGTQEWLLPRINPKCEICHKNDHYNLIETYVKPFLVLPFGKWHRIIKIVCPACTETIELDFDEYLLLEPYIKLNNLLESGKIDEYSYKYRLDLLESKRYDR